MHRLAADHTRCVVFPDIHLLANQMTDIDAAHIFKAINSFAIVGDDHEPNFVHVSVEHYPNGHTYPHPAVSRAGLGRQYISSSLNFAFVREWFNLPTDNLSYFAFSASYGNEIQ